MGLAGQLKSAIVARPWIARPVKRFVRSRWFTNLSLYQRWALHKAAALDAQLPEIKPWILIEPNVTCNARCRMCVHSQRDMRGEMSLELYSKLIREVADWGIPYVTLAVYGEPFADRYWLRRIEILRAAGLHYDFVSNASLMKPEVLERMFDLGGWDKVIFSVNGFSAAAYEQMMPPLKRDAVYGKIEQFLQMKQQRGISWPDVQISCVLTRLNVHEQDEFRRYWMSRPGVSRVMLADCGTWNGQLEDRDLALGGEQQHVAGGAWLSPCPQPWRVMVVLCDGRVVPCNEECGSRRLIVGDTNQNTLREIFYGGPMRKLRELHLSNKRSSHALCAACGLNVPWV